jgi:hypothetical protein
MELKEKEKKKEEEEKKEEAKMGLSNTVRWYAARASQASTGDNRGFGPNRTFRELGFSWQFLFDTF